jgi:hypothetical protein
MNETYTEALSVMIEKDLNTRQKLKETWRDDKGRLHRMDEPAVIEYDLSSGEAIHSEYWFRGRLDRKSGPAIEVIDPVTKIKIREEWFRNNERHRDKNPALIIRNRQSGDIIRSEFHTSNKSLYKRNNAPGLG